MKENFNETSGSNSKPPCKGYNSYDELLVSAREDFRSALECLGRICLTQIVPSLKRNRVSDTEAEDAAIVALAEFIQILKYNVNVNIGLLWRIAKNRLIDIIRKRKNDDEPDSGNPIEPPPTDNDGPDGIGDGEVNKYIELFKEHYLTEKETIVFILHYEENLSMAEIVKETEYSQAEVYRIRDNIVNVKKKKFEADLRKGKI